MAKAPNRNKNKNKPNSKRPDISKSGAKSHMNHSGDKKSYHKENQSLSQQRQVTASNLHPTFKNGFFLHGRNSVEAALKNKLRECTRIIGTEKAFENAADLLAIRPDLKRQCVDVSLLDSAVGPDSPHQGLLLEVSPLPSPYIDSLKPIEGQKNIVLILDQVTDPHNVGACLRSAAALGARALITQDRNSPFESGVLARASSGGIETCPWIRTVNLAQALDELKEMGYWSVGLDGDTELSIRDVKAGDNIAVVMGSEGSGMRPLVRKHCDLIAKIPMSGLVESLNVSNAAAIALYELIG
jgi:23S rRNA (guanosine2251-2'-O)-methyltransferase